MTQRGRSDIYAGEGGSGWVPIRQGTCVEIRLPDSYVAIDESDEGEIMLTVGTIEAEATIELPPSIAAYVAGLLATQAGVKFG
jgi:hypothetical protein